MEPVEALPPNENEGAELDAPAGVALPPNPNDPLLAPIPDPRLNPTLDDDEAPPNANEEDDAAEGVELAPNSPPVDDATGVPLAPPNEKPLEALDDANENPFCPSVPGVPDAVPPKENAEPLVPPNEDAEPPAEATRQSIRRIDNVCSHQNSRSTSRLFFNKQLITKKNITSTIPLSSSSLFTEE